ncbi:MAG: CHAT domain-containing protein, partial [Candidatus Parabeggiatoa sp.]|nr:CHAT domain-containing protein [Candidatus Parabeggiatoa sp.]
LTAVNELSKGVNLYNQGELRKARDTFAACLSEYDRLITKGQNELLPILAYTRMNYGICLWNLGELPLARSTLETCLTEYALLITEDKKELKFDLFGQNKCYSERALARMYYGNSLYSIGDFHAARSTYEICLKEYDRLIDDGQKELRLIRTLTHTNYGRCFHSLGDFLVARSTYETCLEEYNHLIAECLEDKSLFLYLLGNLPTAYDGLQFFSSLIDHLPTAYRSIFDIYNKEFNRLIIEGRDELYLHLALTRMNYGDCLHSLGDFQTANCAYDTCFEEFDHLLAEGQDKLRPILAYTYINYGINLLEQGYLSLARRTLEICLIEYDHLIAEGQYELRHQKAYTRMNLGVCLRAIGNLPLARRTLKACIEEYNRLIAKGQVELRSDLARTHYNLGTVFKDIGDYPATEINYHTSLILLQTLQTEGQLFRDTIKMMRVIANWHRNPQRPKGPDKPLAFKLAQQGLDWLDTLLNRISDTAKNVQIEQNLASFHLATELALELNQPEQAYLILERSKSRVLVEQMLRERAEPGSHVDENLRTQYRERRAKLRSLVNQLGTSTPTGMAGDSTTRFFTPTTRSIERPPQQTEQLWQQQQAVEQELDKVRRAITEQDAAFGEAIQPRPLTVEEVIALIPADTLVIAFEQGPDFLRLYAITAQGIPTPLQIDLSSQQVNERVEAFKNKMAKDKDEEGKDLPNLILQEIRETELTDIIHWLDSHLKPAFTKLIAQVKPAHIVLIPHVSWHLLPIHLVNVEDEPLTVRYPIHYLPSLQILRLISERPSAQQEKGCIIANPTQNLAGAEQESQTVYDLRGQRDKLLSHQQANLSAVRAILNNIQHSHFSCHGLFDKDLTQAGLILADGVLAAKEMFTSIRMDNPRLVVMSACETAQIKPTLADEYMGLSSSFLFAGTHNVLSTLWRVDDNASRLLIEDFYQGLNEGLSPVKALQQAQRHLSQMTDEELCERLQIPMIATGSEDFSNPYYWAGFVLIGDGK